MEEGWSGSWTRWHRIFQIWVGSEKQTALCSLRCQQPSTWSWKTQKTWLKTSIIWICWHVEHWGTTVKWFETAWHQNTTGSLVGAPGGTWQPFPGGTVGMSSLSGEEDGGSARLSWGSPEPCLHRRGPSDCDWGLHVASSSRPYTHICLSPAWCQPVLCSPQVLLPPWGWASLGRFCLEPYILQSPGSVLFTDMHAVCPGSSLLTLMRNQ